MSEDNPQKSLAIIVKIFVLLFVLELPQDRPWPRGLHH